VDSWRIPTACFLEILGAVKCESPIVTSPLSGFSSKFRQRNNVDFPEPEGPMIAKISPVLTFKSALYSFLKKFGYKKARMPILC
jgi:hypothetical protein